MKFIDLANITVIAGNGGDGCISFYKKCRNNFLGKPNGSNGGDGGNVWLSPDINMNTLDYFSYNRVFRAGHGIRGRSRNCTGKQGNDVVIKVPVGTRVYDENTNELLGDIVSFFDAPLMVAKGGRHGLGNNNFKRLFFNRKDRNIAYYNKKYGIPGEFRHLLLELILIADVGIFGLPNSGKSSFVSMISNSKTKIANYPFTTLIPNLGTVRIDDYGDDRFVIADIPGIVKGASNGLGLGIKFLKHLERCSMLLHFVDINPIDDSNPLENIISIEQELNNYNSGFFNKTRWLIFNKIDLLNQFKLNSKINDILRVLQWKDRYYSISSLKGTNISLLCYDIMEFINYSNSSMRNI